MMMINRLIGSAATLSKAFFGNVMGVAGIEAAFIFPVMLMIYFGLLDLTTVLSANRRVTQMARTLADLHHHGGACWVLSCLDSHHGPLFDERSDARSFRLPSQWRQCRPRLAGQ